MLIPERQFPCAYVTGGQLFFLSALKIQFYFLLSFVVDNQAYCCSVANHLFFSLATFKISLLFLVISYFIFMYLEVYFFFIYSNWDSLDFLNLKIHIFLTVLKLTSHYIFIDLLLPYWFIMYRIEINQREEKFF